MTEVNNYLNSERDEKYSTELLAIRDGVVKIIDRVGDRFDELLTDKAARFLILKTIQKHKVDKNALRYFPSIEAATEFFNWLIGPPQKPLGDSDSDIGKYCIALFLAYDRCAPEKRLYSRIVGIAFKIVLERFPESPLFNLIEKEDLQLEDVLNDCSNPPRNSVGVIDHLKGYLNRVNAYLSAEGFRIEPDIVESRNEKPLQIKRQPNAKGRESEQKTDTIKEAENVFKKDGDFWQVAYQSNNTTTIRDNKGMSYIHRLLEKPDESMAAMQFFAKGETIYAGSGKQQEVVDSATIADCRKRLSEIESELAEAEKNNDFAAQERLGKEKEEILNLLNTDTFKGKKAKFSDDKERARIAVTNAINRALDNIKEHNQPLYRHLNNSILRGSEFTYTPDKEIDWEL
jgi:hypothetical protein